MRKTAVTIAAIVGACMMLPGLLGHRLDDPAWLALALASAACALGALALARARLLEFDPQVHAGDVIVPREPRGGEDGVRLLLPLQFVNAGGAGGIVQWMALRVTLDGKASRSLLLGPVAEVDLPRFLQAKRRLNADNAEPLAAFALDGRRTATKYVAFDVAEKARYGPLRLRPGRYAFELFVKSTACRAHRLAASFGHAVEAKHLEELRNDTAVYLIGDARGSGPATPSPGGRDSARAAPALREPLAAR